MLEVIVPLLVVLVLVMGGLALWRGILGKARRPWLRVVLLGLILLPVVAFATWRISKARHFQFFGGMVTRVETAERAVALTFDDDPTPGRTEEILAILAEYDARATFFLVGQAIEENMAQCQTLAEAGHELGNHSYSHQQMVFRSLAFVREEIETTDRLIRACGYEGAIHFRSPYGKRLLIVPYYLHVTDRLNIYYDVEPESYPDIAHDADRITEHVLARARPGSIILLHVMAGPREETLRAVPEIIEGLQAQGYRFVTVSELIALEGDQEESGD
jgi:peptidoglycan/xylan/chitin deacetylase (PgdA/CDA1 family)